MKKLQNEILLIFFLIGIIIILGMGAFFGYIINQSNIFIGSSEHVTSQELHHVINAQINQTKILILVNKSLPVSLIVVIISSTGSFLSTTKATSLTISG